MKKRMWFVLIALSILVPEMSRRAEAQAIARDPRNAKLNQLLLLKAQNTANQGLQTQAQQADSIPKRAVTGVAFITFDVQGGLDTSPVGIDPAGTITGNFHDANFAFRGFLRSPDGRIATFEAPNAGTGFFQGTFPAAINPEGSISGSYSDAGDASHGFLRTRDGAITTFDVPGAGTGPFQGTFIALINQHGEITGNFSDSNDIVHAFVRTREGVFTTFDFPDATFPFVSGINPEGTIVGSYSDANNASHGFLRTHGALLTFDPPDSLDTFPESINPEGSIAGSYFQPISGNPFGGNFRGFVRALDGNYATFDAATYLPCCIFTTPVAINPAGTITGNYNDGFDIYHGFVRTRKGTITTFDPPGAGTGHFQGTSPVGINPEGTIAGSYKDASGATHGFLRK